MFAEPNQTQRLAFGDLLHEERPKEDQSYCIGAYQDYGRRRQRSPLTKSVVCVETIVSRAIVINETPLKGAATKEVCQVASVLNCKPGLKPPPRQTFVPYLNSTRMLQQFSFNN